MRTMPVPTPIRMTLRPTVATGGGYLFFSTSDALVREALAVKDGKAGLKSTPEFKKLANGVPLEGNQFCFLSESFGRSARKIQERAMEMDRNTPTAIKDFVRSLMPPDKAAFSFMIGANTDEGWIMVGNGNQSGPKMLAA